MRIAVLAVQGAFIEHRKRLENLGAETFELRQKKDLEQPFDGLVLPGGESTVMGKLLRELDMFEPLKEKIAQGLPVFGTCAGMILLANDLEADATRHFQTMDIMVKRNAYGRQLGSFHATALFGDEAHVPMTFIRAPYICKAGPNVEILSTVKGNIVAAREGNQLVTAFHPELDADDRVHRYFLSMVRAWSNSL